MRRWFFGCAVQLFKNGFLGLIVGQIQDGSGPERPACVPGLVCSTLRGLLDVSFTGIFPFLSVRESFEDFF